MSDPLTVFISGIKGELLTPADRFLYYFEWKSIFTVVAALCSLAFQILVLHQSYGNVEVWLIFVFWGVLLILESIKKYDVLFHKNSLIVDGWIAILISFMTKNALPLPPDISEQLRTYVQEQERSWPKAPLAIQYHHHTEEGER